MNNWTDKQNEAFNKIFNGLDADMTYSADALTMLKLNDANFVSLYERTTTITGEAEDVDLCKQRAIHLNCNDK